VRSAPGATASMLFSGDENGDWPTVNGHPTKGYGFIQPQGGGGGGKDVFVTSRPSKSGTDHAQ